MRPVFISFLASLTLLIVFRANPISSATISKDLVLKNVERDIDVVSQLVKINTKIVLENTGKTPLSHFLYAIEPSTHEKLSYIGASKSGGDDENKKQLQITPVQIKEHKDYAFWEIKFPQPLEAGRTSAIDVETIFTQLLHPYPSQITQGEKQLVLFKGNLYFFTPYASTSQSANVVVTSNVESFTKVKPFTHSDSTITYGPYENVPAFSQAEMRIHYENNNPFLVISKLERLIEVSHWGNIAVEEVIHLSHAGAILKGPFSRYEYQREQSGVSSVRSFKTVLPAAASDVYYRDEIGNISTSHLRVLEDSVEMDIRPRFPLFGGWKTQYTLGYNLPSYEYLYNSGQDFILKMRFVDHVYDDMVVEQITLKVILPEGAKELNLQVPYQVQRSQDTSFHTYLDTIGRPVLIAHKENLVESHIQEFELHYKFQKLLMFQEPLLVVVAFYLLFFLVIIYVRMDFSISKDEQSESKMKLSSLCDNVRNQQDRLCNLYQNLDSAVASLKSGKDTNAFQNANKKIVAEHKTITQSLTELIGKLKAENTDAADKVTELLKINRQLKDLYAQNAVQSEKLVNGKMKKEQYMDNLQSFNQSKDDCLERIETVVKSL